ncbi:unnamed protein product [Diatraea saccharalis]|uniref:Ig-like domain-containing protein n=1 Tax=Diatraea saccharalis TaxID=40085 RepID=A0A9N9WGN2_9NEOP|nr:unnamed protein product [Diatraea saccharalis]
MEGTEAPTQRPPLPCPEGLPPLGGRYLEYVQDARRAPSVGLLAIGTDESANAEFILPYARVVQSVRIINMRVPEVIQYGTKDSVTLDCDYVTDNVTGLVVKWFYMDKSQPVYQWIPPQKPQALGRLKNKLDLNYKVSHNPYTQHRALHIMSLSPDLTGNYTCVVSTFLAEDQKTRPMAIFDPEKKFDMILDRLADGYLNIICSVEGVYPKPELVILAGNRPLNAKSSLKIINDRYVALTSAVVKVDALPPTVEILCDMQVAQSAVPES